MNEPGFSDNPGWPKHFIGRPRAAQRAAQALCGTGGRGRGPESIAGSAEDTWLEADRQPSRPSRRPGSLDPCPADGPQDFAAPPAHPSRRGRRRLRLGRDVCGHVLPAGRAQASLLEMWFEACATRKAASARPLFSMTWRFLRPAPRRHDMASCRRPSPTQQPHKQIPSPGRSPTDRRRPLGAVRPAPTLRSGGPGGRAHLLLERENRGARAPAEGRRRASWASGSSRMAPTAALWVTVKARLPRRGAGAGAFRRRGAVAEQPVRRDCVSVTLHAATVTICARGWRRLRTGVWRGDQIRWSRRHPDGRAMTGAGRAIP